MVGPAMRIIRLVAVAAGLATVAGGCATSPDATLTSRLVGKWSQRTLVDRMYVEHATELRPDGTFARHGVVRDVKGSRPYSARGAWHVKGAVYYEDIEWSDFPGWKRGPETHHALVAVSEWEWVMKKDVTGEEIRFQRYPNE